MQSVQNVPAIIGNLNALVGGLFIISTFGIMATRQVRACLKFFILQSIFLACSAFLLGSYPLSIDLFGVGLINLFTKVWFIPWLLRRFVKQSVYTRREITQVVSIPISLLIALILTILAYSFSLPWIGAAHASGMARINVPLGLAALLLGVYTLTTRREAVPQLLGLLSMENGAFFVGIAIAPDLPLIVELALTFDILVLTFIIGILTRTVHKRLGTTMVGTLATLREDKGK